MQTDSQVLPAHGNDTVEILKNDHQVIKQLLTSLSQSQGNAARGVLEKLKAALTIHNATEENLVYPALQTVAGEKAQSDHLYHETAAADVLVFEIDSALKENDSASFSAKVGKLKEAVFAHIEAEETSAFPNLQKKASSQDAQALTAAVKEFRGAFRFESPSP